MGKVYFFQIFLDNKQGVYLAGDVIKGELNVVLKERIKIKQLKLELKGSGRVNWIETRSGGNINFTETFCAEEEYIDCKIILLTREDSNNCFMEIGDHSYPFEIHLPQNLPNSFEFDQARIRYKLKGHLEIPWTLETSVSINITIISPFDLRSNPVLKVPVITEEARTFCCFWCKSDPILIKLSLSKIGFLAGEVLSFKASIDNRSSYTVGKVVLQLIQDITLITKKKTRLFQKFITDVAYLNIINAYTYDEWSDTLMISPEICPSSNGLSNIIDISYSVVLLVKPLGPHASFFANIPITIGTIPFECEDENPELLNFDSKFETDGLEENLVLDNISIEEIKDEDFPPNYSVFKDNNFIWQSF